MLVVSPPGYATRYDDGVPVTVILQDADVPLTTALQVSPSWSVSVTLVAPLNPSGSVNVVVAEEPTKRVLIVAALSESHSLTTGASVGVAGVGAGFVLSVTVTFVSTLLVPGGLRGLACDLAGSRAGDLPDRAVSVLELRAGLCERVASEAWDDAAFRFGCCGGGAYW